VARDRDLNVNIRGNADDFDRATKSAAASAKVFQRAIKEQEEQLRRQHEAMDVTGRVMVGFGAAVLGGLGLATKAAVDWETAWAGVTKTVDGTAPQMAALEEALRSLAQELPASHQEIAAVAEAAGQLGVERENIVAFTRTMINLGETTNLSAEEAASALARFMNVMGTSQGDVDKLGSALVALGNNSATTEAEILQMAQRLAGAGRQIGITEGEVLGFAAALSSVGINAEAGGSAFSRVMITMEQAARSGGEELEGFARVAGMSAQEFQAAYEQDAAGAIVTFIQGLARMQSQGQDVFGTLDALSLGEIRVRDSLLRAAGASDLFADSLRLGNESLEQNTALAAEAAKRYETTASQMQIARNNLNEFAITMGETFLPVLGAVSERTGAWLQMLSDLPGPVRQGIAVLGSLAGAASLVGGAALIAVPKVSEFRATLDAAGGRAAALNRGLGRVGAFLGGPWGIALAGAVTATGIFLNKKAEAAAAVRDFTSAIEADSGAMESNTIEAVNQRLAQEGLFELADKLGIEYGLLTQAVLGNEQAQAQLNSKLDATQTGVSSLIPGMNGLAATVDGVTGKLRIGQGVVDENTLASTRLESGINSLTGSMQGAVGEYQRVTEANRQAGVAQDNLTGATGEQTLAQQGQTAAMGETESQADALKASIDRLTGANITATEADIRFRDQVMRLTESLKSNGGTFDLNTEQGRRNMEQLLRTSQSSGDLQVALAEQSGSTEEATQAGERHRRKLIDIVAQSIGNRDEARKLVDQYLAVGREVDRTNNKIDAVPSRKRILVTAAGRYEFVRSAEDIRRGRPYASGGILPGYTPGRDVHDFHAADGSSSLHLSGGEAVMRPEWTRAVGPRYVAAANAAARTGGPEGVREFLRGQDSVHRFARGGIYEWAPDAIAAAERDVSQRAARDLARRFKAEFGGPLGGAGGPGGWRWQMAVLRRVFPGLQLISGYRPGAITATGNRSYHALGRAVDVPPRHDVFNWVRGVYGRNTKELIFSPANNRQVWNGRPHFYSEPTRGDHWDHIHWAYDRGGIWRPGTFGWNLSGRPERVLTPRQTEAFERLIKVLDTRFGSLHSLVGGAFGGGAQTKQVQVMPGATVNVAQPVDVDLLSQRLGFAAQTASF
jgi:TP901 family phage tail tape measure protein